MMKERRTKPLELYDPIVRHFAIEDLVTKDVSGNQERRYWRFRFDRWYGGIVTADSVGCELLCRFCWVSDSVMSKPGQVGKFYSGKRVANILVNMARKKSLQQLRVSGGEPTIGRKHLIDLLENLSSQNVIFILETNGLLIGYDQTYAKELSKYSYVHVRVALKGSNEEEFVRLTGARPEGFQYQLKALENLVKNNVPCHPAVMISFSSKENLLELTQRINEIDLSLIKEIEMEELILYPKVLNRIRKHGLRYYHAYTPRGVPKELV
jgi:uncharacterized Fe-S cluster-containing radical SAM superfamily protein